jgi:AcrR family transcriptional regulator
MTTKAPTETRKRILHTAFNEFYVNGFQGGSLNHIVEQAGTTKGALFHHFRGKNELGYAVVDEILMDKISRRWLEPLAVSNDPIKEIKAICRRSMEEEKSNDGISSRDAGIAFWAGKPPDSGPRYWPLRKNEDEGTWEYHSDRFVDSPATKDCEAHPQSIRPAPSGIQKRNS